MNNLKYFEENDPDIYFTGLESFSFEDISLAPEEYDPSKFNLGKTGKLIFDCFRGSCSYQREEAC